MLLNFVIEKIILIYRYFLSLINLNYNFGFNFSINFSFCLTLLSIIIMIIIIILLLLRTIYKLGFYGKMNFNTFYDFFDYFKEEDIINKDNPKWNKYCNIENISILDTESNKDIKVKESLTSINDFIKNKISNNENNIINYNCLTSCDITDYIACYKNKFIIDSVIFSSRATMKIKTEKDKNKNTIISLPIHEIIHYNANNISNNKNNIFQNNFATLYYYQNSNTPNVFVSLFKYEKIWNVKPLCYLSEYFYEIDKSLDYNFAKKKALRFFEGKKETLNEIFDFLDKKLYMFDVVITTEIKRLLHLLDNNLYIVIGCVLNGKTIGVLFFKNLLHDNFKEPILELHSSVFSKNINGKIRQACFSRGLIIANKNMKCSVICINNTSHNNSILNMININMKPKFYSGKNINNKILDNSNKLNEKAYYLHNYRFKTKKAENCLIIT
jgi:hypothetical protein